MSARTLRAAPHVHSVWSYDGRWTLPDLASAFERRGYDAVLLAEHDVGFSEQRWREYKCACAEASTKRLLLVPGIEYQDAANRVHVIVWGDLPFLGSGLETGDLLRAATELGGFPVLAHPRRRDAWDDFTPDWVSLLYGIELWNRKYDGWAPSRLVGELRAPAELLPFLGLDFHTARQFFPLAMSLQLEAPPSVTAVFAALRARRCSPRAFGVRAAPLVAGPGLVIARGAERGRRIARGAVKAARAGFHSRAGQRRAGRVRSDAGSR